MASTTQSEMQGGPAISTAEQAAEMCKIFAQHPSLKRANISVWNLIFLFLR